MQGGQQGAPSFQRWAMRRGGGNGRRRRQWAEAEASLGGALHGGVVRGVHRGRDEHVDGTAHKLPLAVAEGDAHAQRGGGDDSIGGDLCPKQKCPPHNGHEQPRATESVRQRPMEPRDVRSPPGCDLRLSQSVACVEGGLWQMRLAGRIHIWRGAVGR